jgi:hypothetical protein
MLVSLLALSCNAFGQSADELAKQTQNPVASLISLPFQANWDAGIGEREAIGATLNIQPVAPFPLTKEWNMILRVIMPVVSQPTDDGFRINGMSDTVATVFLSPARSGKVIWGAGPVMLLPTATNNALGSEKIGFGPSVVALVQPEFSDWCGSRHRQPVRRRGLAAESAGEFPVSAVNAETTNASGKHSFSAAVRRPAIRLRKEDS